MKLAAWDIFWVQNCRHSTPPKDKFVLIVSTTPRILGFFINSNPPRNLDPDSKAANCYAGISETDTEPRFFSHSGVVGCDQLFEYERGELPASARRGVLAPSARQRVRDSAQKCPRLKRPHKIKVNEAFSSRP